MAIGSDLFLSGRLSRAQLHASDFGQKRHDQFNRDGNDSFGVRRQLGVIVKTFPSAVGAADSQALAIGAFDQKDTAAGR
jgi:hypothetical protein